MPRPKRIHKKKSFMFTSRHHSFIGGLSMVLAGSSLLGLILSIILSYIHGGEAGAKFGAVGLFGILENITGGIAAIISLRERDIYTWLPRLAMALHILGLLLWGLLMAWGA